MLPFVLGGAALALAYKTKPACSVCGSKFTWNTDCVIGNKPVCGSCGEDYPAVEYKGKLLMPAVRCCKTHVSLYWEKVAQEKSMFDRMEKAISDAKNVKLFGRNYKGAAPPPKLGKKIETEWDEDKDEAEFQLKVLAALEGCAHVTQMDFKKDTAKNGNYKYSVWCCSGMI